VVKGSRLSVYNLKKLEYVLMARWVLPITGHHLPITGFFMTTEAQYTVRPANWLPLPGVTEAKREAVIAQRVDENDNYSKAIVEEFYPRQGKGVVLLDDGTRIAFDVQSVNFVGEKAHPSYLQQGARVGYDIGVTSKGPRISAIKVY
jgi:cold shock CspA family protein